MIKMFLSVLFVLIVLPYISQANRMPQDELKDSTQQELQLQLLIEEVGSLKKNVQVLMDHGTAGEYSQGLTLNVTEVVLRTT